MINLEEEKKHFKNHKASLQDCGSIGKRSTGIVELYMLAFKLAMEDLRKQEFENGN